MSPVSAETSSASRVSLAQLYRATVDRNDSPFDVYVSRPLAAPVVYGLLGTRVAPNQVTFFSAFLAAAAASCFIGLTWPLGLVAGVVLVELSHVFEKAGGMLARARGQASAAGKLLQVAVSELEAFVVLAAVAVGAFQHRGRVEMLLVGLAGVVCLASRIVMSSFMQRPEVLSAVAGGAAPPVDESEPPIAPPRSVSTRTLTERAARLADGIGRFLIHYPSYLWLAAPFNDARWFVYPYVAVNALYAARSLGVLLWSYGGWAPPSAEALTSLRRAVELVEQEGDDIG
jgi:phosphatidylglycerophosphate synthase